MFCQCMVVDSSVAGAIVAVTKMRNRNAHESPSCHHKMSRMSSRALTWIGTHNGPGRCLRAETIAVALTVPESRRHWPPAIAAPCSVQSQQATEEEIQLVAIQLVHARYAYLIPYLSGYSSSRVESRDWQAIALILGSATPVPHRAPDFCWDSVHHFGYFGGPGMPWKTIAGPPRLQFLPGSWPTRPC